MNIYARNSSFYVYQTHTSPIVLLGYPSDNDVHVVCFSLKPSMRSLATMPQSCMLGSRLFTPFHVPGASTHEVRHSARNVRGTVAICLPHQKSTRRAELLQFDKQHKKSEERSWYGYSALSSFVTRAPCHHSSRSSSAQRQRRNLFGLDQKVRKASLACHWPSQLAIAISVNTA